MYNTEASLKYFIVQVLASATLLFIVVIKTLTEDLFTFERNLYTPIIICTPLLLKSGAAKEMLMVLRTIIVERFSLIPKHLTLHSFFRHQKEVPIKTSFHKICVL